MDLNLYIQNMPDATVILDTNGYITFCNKAALTLSGYHEDDLLGKSFTVLDGDTNDEGQSLDNLAKALTAGRHVSKGWKVKKDKSTYWAESTITPLFDEHQKYKGSSYVIQEITNRLSSSLTSFESGERYRLMIEDIWDYGIYLMDTQGYIQTWNKGSYLITGYTSSEIINKHVSMFHTEEGISEGEPAKSLDIAIQYGRHDEEGWRRKKDGSLFWANIVTTALFNENNELIGFSKVTRDLTGKQKNSELLHQSEERYRSLVEQVTDYGIFMLDKTGCIVSWNEGARRIKGYAAHEIIGKHFSVFYPQEEILNEKPALELKVAKQEGKYEEEGWRLRKDGSRFWANIVITAVYNTENRLIGFSKVTRDLTERKKNEEALKKSFEEYRELAQKLKLTNMELSVVNQELEQFTETVSHDLLEPLRTAKSFLYLLNSKLRKSEFTDLNTYVDKSVLAVERMKSLIDNLLHYAKVSKGEIEKKDLDTSELVDEALTQLAGSINNSGAHITIDLQATTIKGDRLQLVQLLQNLVSNALKFVDGRTPEIKITSEEENDFVKFAIKDNGIGMEPSSLDKVFDVFRRLHTIQEYPGTGIGLALCKKIVERHEGKIWPESEKGMGTTFYFTIGKLLK